jgi:5'-phosphate synthase pdxT subunit
MMYIGVLALQGAFAEHIARFQALGVSAGAVRLPADLEACSALVIPGGESTTIGKLASDYGLLKPLRAFGQAKPIWGTCAGMIFMAKDIGLDRQPILGLMDIVVNRNAFGRQRDSFETDIPLVGVAGGPFHAVFIRAPLVTRVDEGAGVQVLGRLADGRMVAVRQKHWLATAFHPELTPDNRLHELFLGMVQ